MGSLFLIVGLCPNTDETLETSLVFHDDMMEYIKTEF